MQRVKLNLGWIVAILSMVTVIFWLPTAKTASPLSNAQNVAVGLGELFGLVGIVIFSLNFILAARLPFIETLFNGLNNVYKKHACLGQLAVILLLLHPLFLLPRYVSSFKEAYSFLFFSNLWARNFGIIALWIILFLVVLTLSLMPKYNIWKITHKFFGLALFLGALHAFLIPSSISNNLLLKSYILFFAILGLLAFFYKSIFGKYLIKTHKYTVNHIKHLNDKVIEITLKPKYQSLQFNPGQFVFISFTQANLSESHPFSISSCPNENLLKVAIKNLGDYTKALADELKKGSVAKIEGPYGVFSYNQIANKNQLWIAGGIGITPFVSFAKDLKNRKDYLIKLFYCVKSKNEAVYLDLFENIETDSNNNFAVVPFYSQEKGHIDADYLLAQTKHLSKKDIFICAPPRMIEKLRKGLMDKKIDKSKIHSEEFSL